jgi:hypothetical protein
VNYISTGGLGDLWMSLLKIRQRHLRKRNEDTIDLLHVESHDSIMESSVQLPYLLQDFNLKISFECDPSYISNYKSGKWKGRIPVSSGVDGWCPLKGQTGFTLSEPFLNSKQLGASEAEIDISFQVSAGGKNNRIWKFDPRILAKLLRKKGLSVALIGNDPRFAEFEDVDNFVGKADLLQSAKIIRNSRRFFGLSGFLNYYACSCAISNVHLTESPQHEERYYHHEWKKISKKLEFPSLQSLLSISLENDLTG